VTLAPKTGTFNLNERFIALEKRVKELENLYIKDRQQEIFEAVVKTERGRVGGLLPGETMDRCSPEAACNVAIPEPPFDVFWRKYPKKKGKGAARKAWKKMKLDSLVSVIVHSITDHMEKDDNWSRDGGQFIPFPSTFLNQERFYDEFDEAVTSEGGEW